MPGVSTQLVENIPVIDADTHLVEPPDLWTSRMSSKWGDLVPHVEWDEENGDEAWFIGGRTRLIGRWRGDGRVGRVPAGPSQALG